MKLTEALDRRERRLVVAACLAAACVASMSTAFNYLLAPMQVTFAATNDQMSVVREAPSIAALLVVFLAGSLGTRVGEKRFMILSALLFTVGCLLVAGSPVLPVATLGFLIANVGRTGMFIVGLGYMSAAVRDQDGRAAAFSFFAMVLPVVSIVMPVLAGGLSDTVGWRWVALICAFLGVMSMGVLAREVPPTPPHGERGELWTLSLAGVILALLVEALNSVSNDGLISPQVFARLAGIAAAVLVLALLIRRIPNPSLDLSLLRKSGFAVLLLILMLFSFANLWFYTTMALQFIFGLDVIEAALAMIPCQVTALAGAALAGRLIQRRGIPYAGLVLSVGVAVCLWVSMVVSADSPVWVPIAIVSAYALAAVGAGVPITNAIMNCASRGAEGDASAFRGAATNLGNAVSVAFMTAIVAGTVTFSLQHQYAAAGMDPSTAGSTQIAQELHDGATDQQLASQYSMPVTEVDSIDAMQIDAFVAGYRMQGLVGGIVTLGVGLAFFVVARRQEREGSTPRR